MTELDQLTKRQRRVYDFVCRQIRVRGRAPSLREIADRFRFRSRASAWKHLTALERKGVIVRDPGKPRGVSLRKRLGRRLPLLGHIGAGGLSEAVENEECFDLGEIIDGEGRGVLKVEDDKLIGLDIAPGSYLIIDPTCGWRKVVAMIRSIG